MLAFLLYKKWLKMNVQNVTVEHVLSLKNAMSQMGFDHWTSQIPSNSKDNSETNENFS
jgi:hypothetical protein